MSFTDMLENWEVNVKDFSRSLLVIEGYEHVLAFIFYLVKPTDDVVGIFPMLDVCSCFYAINNFSTTLEIISSHF